ncbi:MAG: sensor histidine kinase [Chitinophagaceae bacterium]
MLTANNKNQLAVKELISFADTLERKIQNYQHTQRKEALSRYEIEESLLKILDLENRAFKQKLIIGFIVLLTLVVAFILGLQYRFNKKILQQKTLIEIQKKALEKLNADKSKYLSVIAHDLRTPLSSLRSVLEMYNDKMIDTTELEEFTGKINKSLSAFTLTFDNLLLWAGMGMKDGLQLHIEKVSISELINDILLALESEINQKQINFSYLKNSDVEFVLADKQLLLVVLRNMLMNAIKFTPQGKKMSLAVLNNESGKNQFMQIIVMNEAVKPLSDKVLSFINDNKYEANYISTKGTDGEKGSGLGLRVIKEFIQKMNGKMGIEKNEMEHVAIYIEIPINK